MLELVLRIRYGKNANLADRAAEFLMGTIVCFAGWTKNAFYISFTAAFCCLIFSFLIIQKEWAQFAGSPVEAPKKQLRRAFFVSFLISFPFIATLTISIALKLILPTFVGIITLGAVTLLWIPRQRKDQSPFHNSQPATMFYRTQNRLVHLLFFDHLRRSQFPGRKYILPILLFTFETLIGATIIYQTHIFNYDIMWPTLAAAAYCFGKWNAYRPSEDLPLYNILPQQAKCIWRFAPVQTSAALFIGIMSIFQLNSFAMIIPILTIIILSYYYGRSVNIWPDFSSPFHSTLKYPPRSILPELLFITISFTIYLILLAVFL